ncbi:hypothetical protein [Granulicella sibirica]|uniref:OmpA-like domain-containing protein n=1 Tax=Granulicella sibirica TaxID=2479048 RepID=A0A4Q0T1E9_9BACT|nr:hypothetical protein [Granulicella sibirica]RXH55719.1 hypothetical protein GRAN_2576 [Granulicella sibirica]
MDLFQSIWESIASLSQRFLEEGTRLSRVAGCAFLTAACATALRAPEFGVSAHWWWAYVILVIGLFVLLESNWGLGAEQDKQEQRIRGRRLATTESAFILGMAVLFVGTGSWRAAQLDRAALSVTRAEVSEAKKAEDGLRSSVEELQKDLRVVALAGRGGSTAAQPPDSLGKSQAEQELKDCLLCLRMKGPDTGEGNGTGAGKPASPDVEALTKDVEALANLVQQHDRGVPWSLVLVFLAGFAALAFVGKKHSEAVPIAGAAGLAAEVVKHADQYAKLSDKMYWWVLGGYLGISFALTVLFCLAIWRSLKIAGEKTRVAELMMGKAEKEPREEENQDKEDEDGAKDGKGKKSDKEREKGFLSSSSSLGYSVLVLLWAFAITAYPAPSRGSAPGVETTALRPEELSPVRQYVKGHELLRDSDKDQPRILGDSLAKMHLTPHDIVLLLGSTDCTPFRKGGEGNNPDLAQKRAVELGKALATRSELKDIHFTPLAVKQHERCLESADLRAVYPFLIRQEREPRVTR